MGLFYQPNQELIRFPLNEILSKLFNMKIPNSILHSISLAILLGILHTSCSKETIKVVEDKKIDETQNFDPCPPCGMG